MKLSNQYRPPLSTDEIELIARMLRVYTPITTEEISVHKKLRGKIMVLQAKIQHSAIAPAYTNEVK